MSQAARAPKTTYELVLLPGDGIGAEVVGDARALLDVIAPAIGVSFALEEIPCGGKFYLSHGSRDWPQGAEEKCAAADAILLGAVGWNGPDGAPVTMADGKMAGWSPVIGNRMKLDLYANVRPVRCLPGTKHGISGQFASVWKPESVDMVILRENTEGLYSGNGEKTAERATDLRVITKRASERVIRKAFEISRERG
jgi:3-isopropylmalate dehydrogenase